ncbi:MAG: amino acid transporter, partial [Bacteroides sp.]
NGLMWIVGGLGFLGSLLSFVLSFIPPSQISTGSNTVWYAVLFIGTLVVVIIPFIIYAAKKPSWVDPNTEFEPFHWEEQAVPTVTPKVAATATPSTASATTTTATTTEADDKNTPKP